MMEKTRAEARLTVMAVRTGRHLRNNEATQEPHLTDQEIEAGIGLEGAG
jgi:hypothetical protein